MKLYTVGGGTSRERLMIAAHSGSQAAERYRSLTGETAAYAVETELGLPRDEYDSAAAELLCAWEAHEHRAREAGRRRDYAVLEDVLTTLHFIAIGGRT